MIPRFAERIGARSTWPRGDRAPIFEDILPSSRSLSEGTLPFVQAKFCRNAASKRRLRLGSCLTLTGSVGLSVLHSGGALASSTLKQLSGERWLNSSFAAIPCTSKFVIGGRDLPRSWTAEVSNRQIASAEAPKRPGNQHPWGGGLVQEMLLHFLHKLLHFAPNSTTQVYDRPQTGGTAVGVFGGHGPRQRQIPRALQRIPHALQWIPHTLRPFLLLRDFTPPIARCFAWVCFAWNLQGTVRLMDFIDDGSSCLPFLLGHPQECASETVSFAGNRLFVPGHPLLLVLGVALRAPQPVTNLTQGRVDR